MKTVFEHIEHVKGKPHHIRKQVALGAATFVSAVIALVWLAGSFAMGSFAIAGSDFAMSTGEEVVATTSDAVSQGLAGVVSAEILQKNVPAHIEIVDTSVSVPVKKQSDQTILPF
ncbi:MAG: hypothetical protein NTV60_00410 [Candidatus Kaiserbacteria bacterium]|nr:hypothetical protein [Candidatus Kaiserbacteria bacterium]